LKRDSTDQTDKLLAFNLIMAEATSRKRSGGANQPIYLVSFQCVRPFYDIYIQTKQEVYYSQEEAISAAKKVRCVLKDQK
jgi:hypothetical protein